MVFVSYTFLFLFLPVLLALYFSAKGKARNAILLAGSWFFYAWWRLDFLALLLFTTALDYGCAKQVARTEVPRRRKAWVAFSVTGNLLVLAYFKYANFGIETFNFLLRQWGVEEVAWTRVILPIGISFYTFESLSYTIDVYRRKIPPAEGFFQYASFVALFPHLVAGPIIRFADIGPQLLRRTHSVERFGRGVLFFMIGFSKKMLLADSLAPLVEAVFDGGSHGGVETWLAVFAYTFQLYFDFSGYSDMAIGLAHMFGFDFPKNFDSPYLSRSITEFWRRWHMTLSQWLRDYLYFSLGGNRRGELRTYVNLLLTMLLGGLWHGASWMFVLWGGYHGTLLVLERLGGRQGLIPRAPAPLQTALTFFLIVFGWALFRAPNLATVGALFGTHGPGGLEPIAWVLRPFTVGALVAAPLVAWGGRQSWDLARDLTPGKALGFTLLFLASLVKMIFASYTPFLYFQF